MFGLKKFLSADRFAPEDRIKTEEESLKREKEKLIQKNSLAENKNVNFDDVINYLAALENDIFHSNDLVNRAQNYINLTILQNQINPNNYYNAVIPDKTNRETRNEKYFNQDEYDRDVANANYKIEQAEKLKQEILQEKQKAQDNFKYAVKQVQNKTNELNKECAQVMQKENILRQELYEVYYENAMLQEEINASSQRIADNQNEESKYRHKIAKLSSSILEANNSIQQNNAKIEEIQKNREELIEEMNQRLQKEIDFISELSLMDRTAYYSYVYSIKQAKSLDEAAQHYSLQRKLDIAVSREIDYEYLTFLAIEKQNIGLLKYALRHDVNCEEALINNKNLIQYAINSKKEEIIDLIMQKAEADEYNIFYQPYEISITYMLNNADFDGIKKLCEKKDSNFISTFKAILDNAIETSDLDLQNKVLELFPDIQGQISNNNDLLQNQEFHFDTKQEQLLIDDSKTILGDD